MVIAVQYEHASVTIVEGTSATSERATVAGPKNSANPLAAMRESWHSFNGFGASRLIKRFCLPCRSSSQWSALQASGGIVGASHVARDCVLSVSNAGLSWTRR